MYVYFSNRNILTGRKVIVNFQIKMFHSIDEKSSTKIQPELKLENEYDIYKVSILVILLTKPYVNTHHF